MKEINRLNAEVERLTLDMPTRSDAWAAWHEADTRARKAEAEVERLTEAAQHHADEGCLVCRVALRQHEEQR
jgi:outer membrane murein-binding lipoprotein Lpp